MNFLIPTLLAVVGAPPMAIIIFWILVILCAIGCIGFRDNPVWVRVSPVVILILFAILGFYTFGF